MESLVRIWALFVFGLLCCPQGLIPSPLLDPPNSTRVIPELGVRSKPDLFPEVLGGYSFHNSELVLLGSSNTMEN